MIKNKISLIIIFLFLTSVSFAAADYTYTTNWFYQGNPVNGVRALNFRCNDAGCYNLGTKISDQTSGSNSITVNYPVPASTNGYATYWVSDCYRIKEMAWKPSGSGSDTDDVNFRKHNDCIANINTVTTNSNTISEGQTLTVDTNIQSAITEIQIAPFDEPSEPDIVQDFISAQTDVIFNVKNGSGDIIHTETKQKYIYWDLSDDFSFDSWTPSACERGTYTIEIITQVPDCKCTNYLEDIYIKTITVNGTGCCTNDECDHLDQDYCTYTNVTHDEGICDLPTNTCYAETTVVEECDDGLYCNGNETCDNAQCVTAEDVDCSGYNITAIETCENDPDNNPFTWDYYEGFESPVYMTTDGSASPCIITMELSEGINAIGGYFGADDYYGPAGPLTVTLTTTSPESTPVLEDYYQALTGTPAFNGWIVTGSELASLQIAAGSSIAPGFGQDLILGSTVPEPATLCLLGLGGLLIRRRKKA